jgi:hypothetical protein
VFSRNFTNKLNDVLEITTAAFTEISVQNWENYCKHVINVEEENTRKDIVIAVPVYSPLPKLTIQGAIASYQTVCYVLLIRLECPL